MIRTEVLSDGYIEDNIAEDHYLGGTLPIEVLQKDRDWRSFMPEGERQKRNGVETNNCTAFGTLSAQEGYMRRKYNFNVNWSDRYLGARAGTKGAGNSPHTVVETQRTFAGMIPEEVLPFSDRISSQSEYFDGVEFRHKLMGLHWLNEWEVQHEWVFDHRETNWRDQLYDSLQFSPIGIAVQAWSMDGDRYVRTGGDTHWCTLVYAKKNDHWLIYDSYAPFYKKLSWDFGFTRAKRYRMIPREDFSSQFYIRAVVGLLK